MKMGVYLFEILTSALLAIDPVVILLNHGNSSFSFCKYLHALFHKGYTNYISIINVYIYENIILCPINICNYLSI